LSNSTSAALTFLEFDLKDINFKNASATAIFCKKINDIFDLLNVRNKFCKTPDRMSINKASLEEVEKKVYEYIQYIEKLEINVKKNEKEILIRI